MTPLDHLSKILETDPAQLNKAITALELSTHRSNIPAKIVEENHAVVTSRLQTLGVTSTEPAHRDIAQALSIKIASDDYALSKLLSAPGGQAEDAYQRAITLVDGIQERQPGFFLKEDAAKALLRQEPPRMIMKGLGYANVDELLANESVWEVFAALRFMETKEWMHKQFFPHYEQLTPQDFEERAVRTIVLGEKWRDPAEYTFRHKYRTVSHLKELGLVFIIPWSVTAPGETLRFIGSLAHYYHELAFYSDVFKEQALAGGKGLGRTVMSLIQASVALRVPEGKNWLIIPRYLAREDENDWRLFYPHVNPEAIFWSRAQNDIAEIGKQNNIPTLEFWNDLQWAGEYFKSHGNNQGGEFISLNLMDCLLSTADIPESARYAYHLREALWNKIFADYLGPDWLEKTIKTNIPQGYFAV